MNTSSVIVVGSHTLWADVIVMQHCPLGSCRIRTSVFMLRRKTLGGKIKDRTFVRQFFFKCNMVFLFNKVSKLTTVSEEAKSRHWWTPLFEANCVKLNWFKLYRAISDKLLKKIMESKVNNTFEDWNSKVFKASLELLVFLLRGHCIKITVTQRLCYDTAVNSDV